jgi:hypothetical protein
MAMEGAAKPCPKCYCRMLAMEGVAKPEPYNITTGCRSEESITRRNLNHSGINNHSWSFLLGMERIAAFYEESWWDCRHFAANSNEIYSSTIVSH